MVTTDAQVPLPGSQDQDRVGGEAAKGPGTKLDKPGRRMESVRETDSMVSSERVRPRPAEVESLDDLRVELERLRIYARAPGKARMSLQDMARASGIPKSSLHNYFIGATIIPSDLLDTLVQALGVTTQETAHWAAAWERAVGRNLNLNLNTRHHEGAVREHADGSATSSKQDVIQNKSLPRSLTRLFGRAKEIRDLREHLETSDSRLVTLTGPPGTGKTRLALAVASDVQAGYLGGVYFVNLAPLQDAKDVVPEIVRALGLTEERGRTSVETAADHLGDRRALLVIDNFEHVVGAAPELVGLLSRTTATRMLVTSRQALRVTAEQVWPVLPLTTPGLPVNSGSAANDPDRLGRNECVQLFLDRAAAATGSQLQPRDFPTVSEICRRLEGVPLAIELAAGCVRSMPLSHLLTTLESSLELLDSGPEDLPERQRSLRATLEWSWGLLLVPETQLMQGLAIFAGGWTIDSAKFAWTGEARQLPRLLSRLVDSSLVQVSAEGRFSMLQIVREYVQSTVEPGDDSLDGGLRLIAWAEEFSRHLGSRLESRGISPGVVRDFEAERFNLNASMNAIVALERYETLAQILVQVGVCYFFARPSEAMRWTDIAVRYAVGDHFKARLTRLRGTAAQFSGDVQEAETYQRQTIKLFQSEGDVLGEILARTGLGHALRWQGRFAEARGEQSKALELAERASHHLWAAGLKAELGELLDEVGENRALAEEWTQQYLRVGVEEQDAEIQSYAHAELALLAIASDDSRAAMAALQSAGHLLNAEMSILIRIDILGIMSIASLALKLDAEAEHSLRQQANLMLQHGYTLQLADNWTCLGILAYRRQDYSACAMLLGAAASLRARNGLGMVYRQLRTSYEEIAAGLGVVQAKYPKDWELGCRMSATPAKLLGL